MTRTGIVAGLGALAMVAVLIYGFVEGDFAGEGRRLLAMPWGKVSLVDLYVGFVLFACWILFRDGITLPSVVWIAAVMILGSLAICLYVLAALRSSRKDWGLFFLGRHAKEASGR
ncbi:DUF1475 family protein [Candidatus Bipolaricaulota bacterium]